MNIKKYLKKSNGEVFIAEWNIIKTKDDDPRGYTIDGIDGKFLTVLSTFIEDAGKSILSINPFENPGLEKYEEISEEEYNSIIKEQQEELTKLQEQRDKELQIQRVKEEVGYLESTIKRQDKILQAVKDNVIYGGDVELMTALHSFTEESLNDLKNVLKEKKTYLGENG